MKVTVIQVDNNVLGIENRLNEIEKQIQQLSDTDFVILTELSTCGYVPNTSIWEYAEDKGKITKNWAISMAKKYNIYIGAGYVEKDGSDYYNSYLIANSEGVLGVVRKSEPESNVFKRGDFKNIIKTPLGNIAVSICFDSHKKRFYEQIKDEELCMIIMPHAWPMDAKQEKQDLQKIHTLITSYFEAFECPVVFANAIGDFEKMAGITGKIMNPKRYKLNGKSAVGVKGKIKSIENNSNMLSFECELENKKRKSNIKFFGDYIDKGSILFRKIVLPLDAKRGVKLYNRTKN